MYHLLNYCATYPNVSLRYRATNMIFHVDLDTSFLITPEAKSRIEGYFRLQNQTPSLTLNVPILLECCTFKYVVTSTSECETVGVITQQNSNPNPILIEQNWV